MITIQKNRDFFDEVSRFNPKLAHILEHHHGWHDKLVYRSDNGSISQPRGRSQGTTKTPDEDEILQVVPKKMGRN
jgi:hypothetical protein